MFLHRIFPRTLAAGFVLALVATTAAAQTETRPRQVTTSPETDGQTRLENDAVIVSLAPTDEDVASVGASARTPLPNINQLMLAAIDARIGTPYRYGASGPNRFDCSGFVWSVFQSAGVNFERGSARMLWTRFAPAVGEEKFKFGTLVFFNNLKHVGIVADEDGFYHASQSQGVVYSPFSGYWSERIDGFRRVPLRELEMARVTVK